MKKTSEKIYAKNKFKNWTGFESNEIEISRMR